MQCIESPGPDDHLWQTLLHLPLDAPYQSVSFAQRLADEHLWTDEFAERVVLEYRRFLYLAATSSASLRPSMIVHRAWHLHVSYTRSYWQDLCENVLAHPLHLEHFTGSTQTQAQREARYALTLTLYEDAFGVAPPAAFWPPTAMHLSCKPYVYVNADDFNISALTLGADVVPLTILLTLIVLVPALLLTLTKSMQSTLVGVVLCVFCELAYIAVRSHATAPTPIKYDMVRIARACSRHDVDLVC